MLGQPFQQFPCQVQAVMLGIRTFQPHQHPQSMGIVVPPAIGRHRLGQSIFARMAERRVTNVMCQTQGLGQILVQPQRARDHPADLRHLQRVREANAVVIAIGRDEHLRFRPQPPKGNRMNDPVAVTLIIAAGAARDRRFQRKFAPPAARRVAGQRSQHINGPALPCTGQSWTAAPPARHCHARGAPIQYNPARTALARPAPANASTA